MKKTFTILQVLILLTGSSFGQWDNFKPPTINFQDKDNGSTEGAKIYHRLVKDKTAYISPVCEDVARHIFYDDSQPIKVTRLDYVIQNYNGISEKGGSPPVIYIRFSTKHVADTWNKSKDDIKVEAEIYGVLFHEMTHGYQLEPKGAGKYDGKSEFWAKIEGEADAVRIRAGYHQGRRPDANSRKWLGGYTSTGFFYNWITNNYDKEFLKKLNLTSLSINPWTFDKAVQKILNKSAQSLWDEYVSVINKGSRPEPQFEADKTTVSVGKSVKFSNTSKDAICYDWTFEGGTPRKTEEENPTVKYDKPGKYKVTLVAHNKSAIGPGIEVKQHYITVVNGTGIDELNTANSSVLTYPNPFSESTNFKVNLKNNQKASLEIFNMLGERVKIINEGSIISEGAHEFLWRGEDNGGKKLPAGQYIYKLTGKGISERGILILSK